MHTDTYGFALMLWISMVCWHPAGNLGAPKHGSSNKGFIRSDVVLQMEHILAAPSTAAKGAAARCVSTEGSGLVYPSSANGHLEQDKKLIARLASSPEPHQAIPSWQSSLSPLGSELVKVLFHPPPLHTPTFLG